eukprot:6031946-Amphidinium_carterae.1
MGLEVLGAPNNRSGGTRSGLREDVDNASQPTEDLVSSEDEGWTEELSNSEDKCTTWEDLAGVDTQARGFASDEEERQFYLDLAYAVSHKTRTSREELRWRMTKFGRRRARRVGAG